MGGSLPTPHSPTPLLGDRKEGSVWNRLDDSLTRDFDLIQLFLPVPLALSLVPAFRWGVCRGGFQRWARVFLYLDVGIGDPFGDAEDREGLGYALGGFSRDQAQGQGRAQ